MAARELTRPKHVMIGELKIHTDPTKAEIDALYRRVGTVVGFTRPAPRRPAPPPSPGPAQPPGTPGSPPRE